VSLLVHVYTHSNPYVGRHQGLSRSMALNILPINPWLGVSFHLHANGTAPFPCLKLLGNDHPAFLLVECDRAGRIYPHLVQIAQHAKWACQDESNPERAIVIVHHFPVSHG
jgi:hypothetical protein